MNSGVLVSQPGEETAGFQLGSRKACCSLEYMPRWL